ncbi:MULTISPECIES: PhzF family phenazine biosynthesis protein [unclassified Janthinobacterium]|uniref:PhzF family phenazine biosynthesis protein n=1 Tax=unclassified Janthinobacterium TaxID=2610881 RepID=UPI000C0F98FD|nr:MULTISPECIES: PhzF family phenazine biosynthesis protein [unclassified Janthinobacterium]MDZ5635781.1 PhzF family phenazine biosynthesis protein [Janthinobacterium sp. GMG1]PHV26754.1 phenazine biosynthesis protein PhzF family protein [Janthinobacterium sp. BJB426]
MIVHLLKCFGAAPGGGNAALVVENDDSSETARQQFARERNVSACVFLDRQADGGIVLDYFYPHTRSPLCLHATLAAAHVLLTAPGAPATLTVSTAMRGQALQLECNAAGLFISLAPQPAPAVMLEKYVPSELMGQHMHLLSPPVIASVGSPKLLLEVADRTILRALRPNLELIADWSALHKVNGCYAYCRTGEHEYEGRNFNHLDPALEDSATGVAAGALAAHWQQSLSLHQGHVTQQPCLIQVQYSAQAIRVGGMVQRST